MTTAIIDGIATNYEVVGSGPALLMYAPGGFDATIDKWSSMGVYAKIKPLDYLPKHYTCILFDRRECGKSGGRVERVTWTDFVRHGEALLDHLKIDRAHMMGGCMGCPPVAAFGVQKPERVISMVLWWPVGGAKYRLSGHLRFAEHLAYVNQNGLKGVVDLVKSSGKVFNADPRGGPWASVIKHDDDFVAKYLAQDVEKYKLIVAGMVRTLFDRDTAPGPEPEDMLCCDVPAIVIPGNDASHATSAARYTHECLPKSEYWDIAVADQTQATAEPKLLEFLSRYK